MQQRLEALRDLRHIRPLPGVAGKAALHEGHIGGVAPEGPCREVAGRQRLQGGALVLHAVDDLQAGGRGPGGGWGAVRVWLF